jgi:tight adherence protein B
VLRTLTLEHNNWATRAKLDLQRAGLTLKVSEYLLLRLLLAIVVALFVIVISAGSPVGLLIALALSVGGFLVPALGLKWLATRRQAAISGQLVETLQLISNGLRSGFAFTQALELAAKQMASPIRDELEHFLRDNSLGAPIEDSLRAMVDRSGSLDLDMVVTSILVQRTTGGNLSEILDNVSETVRERYRLQGEMRALTASQRLTGLILSLYPLFLLGVFSLIAPSVMKVLVTEELGRILLGVAITLQVIGALAIRRITSLEV